MRKRRVKLKSTGTPSFAALRSNKVAKRILVSHGRRLSSPSYPPPRLRPLKYPHGEGRMAAEASSTSALPPVQECTCGPHVPPPQAVSSPWKRNTLMPEKQRSSSAALAAVSKRAWDAQCVAIHWGRGISRAGWLRVGCSPLGITTIPPSRHRGRPIHKRSSRWVLKARGTGMRHPRLQSRRSKYILSSQLPSLPTPNTTSHQKALHKCHLLAIATACRNPRRYTLTDTSQPPHPRSSHPVSGTGSPVSRGIKSLACCGPMKTLTSPLQVRARAFINK